MLTFIATVIALALVAHGLTAHQRQPGGSHPRGPVIRRLEIVCLDCAGMQEPPQRTGMTQEGRCEVCGGRAFLLASTVFEARRLRALGQSLTSL